MLSTELRSEIRMATEYNRWTNTQRNGDGIKQAPEKRWKITKPGRKRSEKENDDMPLSIERRK